MNVYVQNSFGTKEIWLRKIFFFLFMKEKFVLKRIMFTKINVARFKCQMKQMRLKTYKTYSVGRRGLGVYYKK